jgi:N-acetylglucosaminyldiphosphoundecaprenol N-acetyl-beta-D-mannosaminyltransferase
MMYKKINVMGYDVFIDDISTISITNSNKNIINTINPHSYVTAKSDRVFKDALLNSNILIPDGSGIVLAAKQLNDRKIMKIAGADLHIHLLNELNKVNGSVFYMGAAPNTLAKIKMRITKEFPNVRIEAYSPPYKDNFSNTDNEVILEKINAFNPDVLFVGMTAPKQEKWLYQNANNLNFKIASSIGAVFDFYAGNINRAPKWVIRINLEWLHRSLNSWRLAKRNLVSNPLFLIDMLKEKFK